MAVFGSKYLVYNHSSLSQRVLWFFYILAALSFLTTLTFPYMGEEAVYTITTLEMFQNKQWIAPTLYGENYGRPPLLNWLIAPVANVLGWQQVLLASRWVALSATLLTTLVLFWLVRSLFLNSSLALFSTLIYLSGDVLFFRGWLAYADPIFALFVFLSIACLWLGAEKKRSLLIAVALLSVMASFLSKAITGYVFYTVAFCVIYWKNEFAKKIINKNQNNGKNKEESSRAFLLSPISLLLHLLAFLFPVVWSKWVSVGAHGSGMLQEILLKWHWVDLSQYGLKILFFPIKTFYQWLPTTGLILFFLSKEFIELKKAPKYPFAEAPNISLVSRLKKIQLNYLQSPYLNIAFWIFILNYMPYWLTPESHTRYLLPLFPLLAMILAILLWQMETKKIKIALCFIGASLLLKYGLSLWMVNAYQDKARPDYSSIIEDILIKTKVYSDCPIFIEDFSSVGLNIAAHLNVARWPESTLLKPPMQWKNGFLITALDNVSSTKKLETYAVGRHRLYLLCRGNACLSNGNGKEKPFKE